MISDAHRLWSMCAALLRAQVSDPVWHTAFEGVRAVGYDGHNLTLGVASALAKERIEGRYLGLVRDALAEAGAADVELVLRIEPPEPPSLWTVPTPTAAARPNGPAPSGNGGPFDRPARDRGNDPNGPAPVGDVELNPRYTFEAFVIGASNRFAHAAALSVAETPAAALQPAVHLRRRRPGQDPPAAGHRQLRARELPGLPGALRLHRDVPERVRRLDALRHPGRVQAPLPGHRRAPRRRHPVHRGQGGDARRSSSTPSTTCTRPTARSSCRPTGPPTRSALEDRLRSRFKWGLITDIQPPELETRLAILRKKAERETARIPPDVLEFIATNITDNIRELEGALIRVSAFASLNHEPLTVDRATQVLADLLSENQPRPITPQLILDEATAQFGFTIEDLRSKNRQRPLVTARQIAMYVLPGAHRALATPTSPGSSAAGTTPPSSTRSRRSGRS